MSLSNYFPMSLEQDILNRKKIADAHFQAGQNIDAGTMRRLLSIQRNYGWMDPGAQLSLAQAGYGGFHQEVGKAAQLALKAKLREQQFKALLPQVNDLGDLKSLSKKDLAQLTDRQRQQLAHRAISGALDSGGIGASLGDVWDFAKDTYNRFKYTQDSGASQIPGDVPLNQGAKAVTREAAVVANTPLQAVQAGIRTSANNIDEMLHGNFTSQNPASTESVMQKPGIAAQTDLGQQVKAATSGGDASLGTGWLPDPNSAVGRAQAQAARDAAPTINGHAFTLGRFVASPLPADSTGFNVVSGIVDAGVAFKADPFNRLLVASSEARAANKFFTPEPELANALADDTGLLVTGNGQHVVPGSATAFLDAPKNQSTFDKLAATKSPSEIWRATGKRWDPDLAYQVSQADTSQAVKDALTPHLGTDIPGPFSVKVPGDLGYSLRTGIDNRAIAGMMPERIINIQDPKGTLDTMDKLMQTAHIPVSVRTPILDRFIADAATGGNKYTGLNMMSDVIGQKLLDSGIAKQEADRLSALFPESSKLSRLYDLDQITKTERIRPGIVIDAAGQPIPTPELTTEWLNSNIQLPDATTLRRSTSKFAQVFTHPAYTGTSAILDKFMQEVWKPLHLVTRIGFPLRVVMDSQASLAANGYTNLYQHPIDTISMMIGANMDEKWAQRLARIPGIEPSYLWNGTGAPILDHFDQQVVDAMGGGWAALEDPTKVALNSFSAVPISHTHAPEGVVSELMRLRGDARVRGLLEQATPEEAKAWFWDGGGKNLRESFIPYTHDLNNGHAAYAAANPGASVIPLDFETRGGSDAWVQTVLDRAHDITAGNTELDTALRTGAFSDGTNLWKNNGLNKSAIDRVASMVENGDTLPQSVKVRDTVFLTRSDVLRNRNIKDQAVRYLFDHMLTLPDKYVDRSPAYVQSYWGSPNRVGTVERYLPYLNPEDRIALLQNAEEANLPAKVLERLRTAPVAVDGSSPSVDAALVHHTLPDTAAQILADRKFAPSSGGALGPGVYLAPGGEAGSSWRAELHIPEVGSAPELTSVPAELPKNVNLLDLNEIKDIAARDRPLPEGVTLQEFRDKWGVSYTRNSGSRVVDNTKLAAQARAEGYDGIKSLGGGAGYDQIVVFDPAKVSVAQATTARAANPLTLDQLHDMAKSDALDKIVNLVHDLHSRSQFFDMTRLMFPFGDAFRRIAQRWATTIWENPNAIYRAQQGYTAAKQAGFFHKDPITGEMVFSFPGSEWLTDKLIGVPIPLQGSVQSMSMVGEGYPGFGPAVTVPAQWFLPDTPQTDGIAKILWPFGRPDDNSIGGTLTQQLEPAWAQKVAVALGLGGPPDQTSFNNTVGSIMNYLASSGDYNLHGPHAQAETARMLNDAKSKAKLFYVIRGAAQMMSPTAPMPKWMIEDKTGKLQVLQVVKDDYRNQLQKLGPDGALKWLLDHYGSENFFAAQAFSSPVGYGVPVTKQGQDWARENPDVKSKYPNTYGLFAPSTGPFDITAFEDQFATGDRTSLTPEQQIALANNRVGMWLYHTLKDKVVKANGGSSPTHEQTAGLDAAKKWLMKRYPGFQITPYDQNRLPRALGELTAAANDPKLASTPAGKGLNLYLAIRAKANEAATNQYGLKSAMKGKDAAGIRNGLRKAAEWITKKYPDFAPMWEQVLSHELTRDVDVPTTSSVAQNADLVPVGG